MAGDVVIVKVFSPLKQLNGLTRSYHAICHYLYNLPLETIKLIVGKGEPGESTYYLSR